MGVAADICRGSRRIASGLQSVAPEDAKRSGAPAVTMILAVILELP
jgi:hypothetical protein